MKVLFLIRGRDLPSSRYRVIQYLPYLGEENIEPYVQNFSGNILQYMKLLRTLKRYEVVFIQRKRPAFPGMQLLNKFAQKIIYDFDDAVMFRSTRKSLLTGKTTFSKTRERRFAEIMKIADHVIAGNNFLKEKALRFTDRVTVIPTPIDLERYTVKAFQQSEDKVIVGWIGSNSSLPYLDRIKDVFEVLGKKYKHLELKIICGTFIDCENIRVIKKFWREEDEVEDLRSLDIGVMPLVDDPWAWGKSGLKILQYYGVGIPVVCTPLGVNSEVVEDGVNGFWARTHEEWVEKLSVLIENPDLRKEMGLKGREVVEKAFSLQVCAPKLHQIIEDVAYSRQ